MRITLEREEIEAILVEALDKRLPKGFELTEDDFGWDVQPDKDGLPDTIEFTHGAYETE